ncbi:MAG: FAD-binding oxidoreductase, partial [Chloroflexi bacterium]
MPIHEVVAEELRRAVGRESVIVSPHDLRIFERDGSIEGAMPDAVVLVSTTQEASEVMKIAARHRIPVVPRGAGTG